MKDIDDLLKDSDEEEKFPAYEDFGKKAPSSLDDLLNDSDEEDKKTLNSKGKSKKPAPARGRGATELKNEIDALLVDDDDYNPSIPATKKADIDLDALLEEEGEAPPPPVNRNEREVDMLLDEDDYVAPPKPVGKKPGQNVPSTGKAVSRGEDLDALMVDAEEEAPPPPVPSTSNNSAEKSPVRGMDRRNSKVKPQKIGKNDPPKNMANQRAPFKSAEKKNVVEVDELLGEDQVPSPPKNAPTKNSEQRALGANKFASGQVDQEPALPNNQDEEEPSAVQSSGRYRQMKQPSENRVGASTDNKQVRPLERSQEIPSRSASKKIGDRLKSPEKPAELPKQIEKVIAEKPQDSLVSPRVRGNVTLNNSNPLKKNTPNPMPRTTSTATPIKFSEDDDFGESGVTLSGSTNNMRLRLKSSEGVDLLSDPLRSSASRTQTIASKKSFVPFVSEEKQLQDRQISRAEKENIDKLLQEEISEEEFKKVSEQLFFIDSKGAAALRELSKYTEREFGGTGEIPIIDPNNLSGISGHYSSSSIKRDAGRVTCLAVWKHLFPILTLSLFLFFFQR